MKSLLILGLATLLLTGCARFGTQPGASDLTENWALSGKMAVRNATEASSFNVDWEQRAQDFEIELSGPLGQGAVQINGEPGKVTLTKGADQVTRSTLRELAYEITELDLPLDYLQYWVRAKPYPGIEAIIDRDAASRQVQSINQSGWQVDYPLYFDETGESLPRRIDFARNGSSGRLVIRNWVSEL
ncbi:lipoprotein insertase outer membrane protein LolB [Saccharospirillum sp.]|uniref:lipoprotein insertase outer membrane protein LolB n=1 Tax=Saccharospirillum sp. TaxID=2033801 RepID=UPI00349FDB6A